MANGVQFPGENVRQWTLLGGGKGGAVGGRRGTMKGTPFWGSSLNAWISCRSRDCIPSPCNTGAFSTALTLPGDVFYVSFTKNHVSFSGTVHFSIGFANFQVLCARKYVSICLFARRNGREAVLPDVGEGMRGKKV